MRSYLGDVARTIAALPTRPPLDVVETLHRARLRSKNVFIVGNGGSSATASHFACDLAKGTLVPGTPRFKATALTDNVPLLTAWANDTTYENIFADQLANLASPGDVVIGFSVSGDSENVLNAMRAGREIGTATIGFTGFDGGKLKNLVDIAIKVPNDCIEKVEDVHLVLTHAICTVLRHRAYEERALSLWQRRASPLLDSPTQQTLRSLAQDLTQSLQVTVCQVLLLDEDGDTLTVWYSWPIRFLDTTLTTGESIPLTESRDHARVLRSRKPVVVRKAHPAELPAASAPGITGVDGFASVGLVPLEVGETVWGLVSLNEMRSWERSPITSEKMDICCRLVREAGWSIQRNGAPARQPPGGVGAGEEQRR